AAHRFQTILDELVAELAELRRPAGLQRRPFTGAVARRMEAAVHPFAQSIFITPMAAVAGSVADEVLAALVAGTTPQKAYVNDGGDIALHVAAGQEIRAAIAGTGHGLDDRLSIRAADPVCGIATSGWRGRSFSLGIADAVTVLAKTAAAADAAATVIANAVNVDHPAIERLPARDLDPDSDLGELAVTVSVGELPPSAVLGALDNGEAEARRLRRLGLIEGAALSLNGIWRIESAGTLLAHAQAV